MGFRMGSCCGGGGIGEWIRGVKLWCAGCGARWIWYCALGTLVVVVNRRIYSKAL
jgi:hypothetical protein